MTNFTIKEASAGTAVNTNLMAGHREQIKPRYRKVARIGVAGSAVVGDAAVDLYYGSTYIGTFYNTSAGAVLMPLDSKDMMPVRSNLVCEPGETMNVIVSDASLTNIIAVTLEIDEL